MARVDDYVAARSLSVSSLSTEKITGISERSGFEVTGEGAFEVPFLNRKFRISFPEFIFTDLSDPEKEIPIQEQVLILHYMKGKGIDGSGGSWIAYREIPGASFYFSSFVKRAIDPLKKVFGNNIETLKRVSILLGGASIKEGDAGFEFLLFPKVPLRLILWAGDEEFPPEANILFLPSVAGFLSPEDVAWLSGMLVYRLISLSYQ
jgi:hypothetical protein